MGKSVAEALVAEIVDEASRTSSEEIETSRACTVRGSEFVKETTDEDNASKNTTEETSASNMSNQVDNVSKESVLQKYSSNEIRLFLKNFMKLIDSNSSLTMSEVSSECRLSEPETREMAAEVTKKCVQSPVVGGK